MTTGPPVPNTGLTRCRRSSASSAKSGPRWSIVGCAMARNTRSGTLVGPGICRKWRPLFAVTTPFPFYAVTWHDVPGEGSAMVGLHDRGVKTLRNGLTTLRVLEEVASRQPVGVGEL